MKRCGDKRETEDASHLTSPGTARERGGAPVQIALRPQQHFVLQPYGCRVCVCMHDAGRDHCPPGIMHELAFLTWALPASLRDPVLHAAACPALHAPAPAGEAAPHVQPRGAASHPTGRRAARHAAQRGQHSSECVQRRVCRHGMPRSAMRQAALARDMRCSVLA